MTKNRNRFTGTFREKAQDYFIQVSLIILSLFVAVGVDRCNTANRQEKVLQEYYEAIAQDLVKELSLNEENLYDCQQDMAGIKKAQQSFRYNQSDSLQNGLRAIAGVAIRGVFRTFSPTTFDVMSSTGDVLLIKDLELRDDLYAIFSFRNNIIQQDLIGFNKQLDQTLEKLGPFIDYACLTQSQTLVECILDREGLVQDPHNELMTLQLKTGRRAYHLEIAIRKDKGMIAVLDSILQQ